MMLKVTARVFKCNTLIGYEISDGQATKFCSKSEAWYYAKNKQIINVIATGTQNDPGISGTNGFELKSLPKKMDTTETPMHKYSAYNLYAAVLRAYCIENKEQYGDAINLSLQGKEQFMALAKQAFNEELAQNNVQGLFGSKKDQLSLIAREHFIYDMTNIGTEPLPVVTLNADKNIVKQELAPNEKIVLNRAEAALTLALPEYNGEISNGYLAINWNKKILKDNMSNPNKKYGFADSFLTISRDGVKPPDESNTKEPAYTTSNMYGTLLRNYCLYENTDERCMTALKDYVSGNKETLKVLSTNALREAIASDVEHTLGTHSNNLQVVKCTETVTEATHKAAAKQGDKFVEGTHNKVIGREYEIKNIGTVGIVIVKLTTKDSTLNSLTKMVLSPGNSTTVDEQELALTLALPEYNGVANNASLRLQWITKTVEKNLSTIKDTKYAYTKCFRVILAEGTEFKQVTAAKPLDANKGLFNSFKR